MGQAPEEVRAVANEQTLSDLDALRRQSEADAAAIYEHARIDSEHERRRGHGSLRHPDGLTAKPW